MKITFIPPPKLTLLAIFIVFVICKWKNYAFSVILQNIVNNATAILKVPAKQL